MLDPTRIRYDLVAVTPQGERLSLIDAASNLSWGEANGELAARLQAKFLNRPIGGGWLHQKLPLGGRVMLLADWGEGWKELFQGTIFNWEYNKDPLGVLSIVAYDSLIYLMKSKDDRYYPAGTKARVIIEDIAKAWGVPIGVIEGPDIALAKQRFQGDTLAAMLLSTLEQAKNRGGGKYVLRASGGKMYVVRPGQNQPVYAFGNDNLQRLTDQQDIEDLVTRVKILGKKNDNGRTPVVATLDGRTEFGVLQDILPLEQYDTTAAAKKAAEEMIKERGQPRKRRSVTAPDLPFLRKGDRIHLSAGTIDGMYIIAGIQHEADSRTMTMEVEEN